MLIATVAPIVASWMSIGSISTPRTRAHAAIDPSSYDNHLYYSFGVSSDIVANVNV